MTAQSFDGYPRVAVLIACYDEAAAIDRVVRDFLSALPRSTVYVYDNNSSDATARIARAAGAVVRRETQQGKGHVVRRMFADIDADVYVLVDGDGTYDGPSAPKLVDTLIANRLDMVNGSRVTRDQLAYRAGHRLGNRLLTNLVGAVFGNRIADMLSGYRVFSKRFVKSFPALATGFEIETELTIHALELGMPLAELATPYSARQAGSTSKLRTYRDGFKILATICTFIRRERPLAFFASIFAIVFVTAWVLGAPVVTEYLASGLVPRLPTAVLATGLMVLSFLALACGLILDTVTQGRREAKRLSYLAIPWGLEGMAAHAAPEPQPEPLGEPTILLDETLSDPQVSFRSN